MSKFVRLKISELVRSFSLYLGVEKKYSHHTSISYENDLEQFSSFCARTFETVLLADVRSTMIRSWIVSMMSENISSSSVNRKISTLRSFYKWLHKKGHTDKNPMVKIAGPKKSKKLPVIVQDVNISRLLEKDLCSEDESGSYSINRNNFIVELLYSTGIRRAELIGLNVSDINLSRKEIRVIGKGNKVRSIPLTESLVESIEQYLKIRMQAKIADSDALILTNKGKRIYPRLVHQIVSRKLSGVTTLSKKSPHVLRHSFATHMLDRGAELNAIKEILGHANLAATQVYTHNSITKLKETYSKAHPRSIK